MDKQQLMAVAYILVDIRVHIATLINLLIEKDFITAKEFDDMQKKCEVPEGAAALKGIKRLFDAVAEECDKS